VSGPPLKAGQQLKGHEEEFILPTHRPDLAREVDLIEEVARVRGMDLIPPELPAIHATRDAGPREELLRRTRHAAVELGLSEALTYAFVSEKQLDILGAPKPVVVLENPLSEDRSVMRTCLCPGLLDAVARARRHGERDMRLFSAGPIFLAAHEGALPEERLAFAAVLAGDRPAHLAKPKPFDAWDAKGLALGMLSRLAHADADVRAASPEQRPKHLHPRGAAFVYIRGERVGRLGPLHPDVALGLDVGEDAVVVEIDLSSIAKWAIGKGRNIAHFSPIPRFPASTRDIALVVREDVPAGEVERAVREAAGALAEDVRIFDRFTGGSVPPDHASLAFHVVYRAPDRTLTDAEVDAQHTKVVAEVGARFGATLR
jgi:phenylalanyl-tRNA synthetase beta chain